jgi:ribonuclease PH
MPDEGRFVEVQGSGEESTFTPEELSAMLVLGKKGIIELLAAQQEILRAARGTAAV